MKNIKRRFFIKSSSLIAGGLVLPSFKIERMANNVNNKKLKVGVSVGSGIGGLETIYEGSLTLANKGPRKLSPFFIPSSLMYLKL